ncbi:MAG: methionine ABC transporter ATP-binding protein [Bacillota bacterium]
MINIKNLSKKYESEEENTMALKNVNLKIKKGEIFGVIGPSGAGKSTLIRTLNLLEKPTNGKIEIKKENLTNLSSEKLRKKRKDIGMIFQDFNLLSSRTVAKNISFPLEISGISKYKRKKKVDKLLKLVGLSKKKNSYPANLSGGQKQRVGIARALANDPEILLSDEATSSLDPESTSEILDLLAKIRSELDLTIILITHEMEVIKEICDKVAVIENGKIVEKGNVIDIFSRPKKDITKRFIKNIIDFELPPKVKENFYNFDNRNGEFIRVNFIGELTHQPLISNLIKKYGINANILYGNIDEIQNTPFGTLVLKLEGDYKQVKDSIIYLKEKGLLVEVLENERINKSVS